MPKCWIVRAGEGSRNAVSFATGSAIAIGWNDIPGLDDLEGMKQDEIVGLLRAAGRSLGVASADANEMIDFRDNMSVGDVVVTPDSPARELLVGEVTGDYAYRADAPVGDYKHVRTVTWYGRFGRDRLPLPLQQQTKYRRTIRLLEEHHDEWAELAEQMKRGDAISVLTRGASVRRATAIRSVARPAPEASAQRCPGCGLQKATTQFVSGSDLCVDCR